MLKYILAIAVAAIGVAAVAAWLWDKYSSRDQQIGVRNRPDQREASTDDHYQPADDVCAYWPMDEPPLAEPPTTEEQHRAEQRRYWKRHLAAGVGLNWITGIAAALAFVTIYFLYDSIVEANRAWVTPDNAHLHSDPKSGEPKIGHPIWVYLNFVNVGGSPAIDVWNGRIFETISRADHDASLPANLCPGITRNDRIGTLHKRPNETYAEGDLARVDSEHHRIIWSPELESQSEFVRVRGCASYVTFNRTRYTSYCYIFGHVRKNDVLIGEKCNGGDYVD